MTRTFLTPVTVVVLWPDENALLNRQHPPSTRLLRGGFQLPFAFLKLDSLHLACFRYLAHGAIFQSSDVRDSRALE